MPAGIVSFGAYVPIYRMSLATIGQMWGKGARKGEKAVANADEDTLTMAVEAATDCLEGMDRNAVDSLTFASTTPVYEGKQTASIVAKVLDLRRDIFTNDIGNSTRGATIGLKSALDSVNGKGAKQALVVAADCRVPAPDTELELLVGDGSAALLIGNTNVAVEIEGSYAITSCFIDIWKTAADAHLHTWEDRFLIECGYFDHVTEVIKGLFKKCNVTAKDFTKVVLYAYDGRRHTELYKKLGFDPKQMQDPLLSTVGHTGTASALMTLVAALEESKAGDRILLINYGDGADAYILKVTDQIEKLRNHKGIKKNLASKLMLPTYGKYAHFRGLMEWELNISPDPLSSLSINWRDRDAVLGCYGTKCTTCGNISFPPQRVCDYCQKKDTTEKIRLADKKGKLFTYSSDNGAQVTLDPPSVLSIVDFEGGGRISTVMTDRDPQKLAPGMTVELTFRKIHDGRHIHNYFWKCRPVRA